MGGSKGILLSGIALIIGIYAVGIKKADAVIAGAAGTRAYKIQSENDARMGLRAGIHTLKAAFDGGPSPGINTTSTFIMLGDTVSYTVVIGSYLTSGSGCYITATSNFKGWKTTIKAYVRKKFSDGSNHYWEVTKSYTVPNLNEAKYVYQ